MNRFVQLVAALLLFVSHGVVDAETPANSHQDGTEHAPRLLPRSLLAGIRSLSGSYSQTANGGYAPPAVTGGYAPSYGSYGYASYGSSDKSAKKGKKDKKDKKDKKSKKSKKGKKSKKSKKTKKEKKTGDKP